MFVYVKSFYNNSAYLSITWINDPSTSRFIYFNIKPANQKAIP